MLKQLFFVFVYLNCMGVSVAANAPTKTTLSSLFSNAETQIWIAVAASVWNDTYDGSPRYAIGIFKAATEHDAIIGAFTKCANLEGRGCTAVGGRAINHGCIYTMVVVGFDQSSQPTIVVGRTEDEIWSNYFKNQGQILERPEGHCVPK